MHALSLFGARDMRLVERERPAGGGNDRVRLKIASVGICGSDLHYYKDGHIGPAQAVDSPFTPGHEFSGYLIDDLPERDLTAGTLVAVDPCISCGACEWCRRGEINLCPGPIFIGAPPHDGALTEELIVKTENIVPVPASIDAVRAALLEPLGICIHAIDLARPQWFEHVVIVGCGPIGLGIIQLLHHIGVRHIIAVDPVGYRRKCALQLGAQAELSDAQSAMELLDGRGGDLVIEATNSPMGFDAACRAARIGGRCVIVGIPDGNSYRFEAATARRKQLSVIFSRRMADVYPRAIELVADQGLDPTQLVSHNISLKAVPEAFEMLCNYEERAIKVMVDPQRGENSP